MNKNHTTTLVTRLFKDERGLTAIELAVVVAILAILAAIVAQNTSGMSSGARSSTQANDVSEVQNAVLRFSADDPSGNYPFLAPGSVLPTGTVTATIFFYAASGSKHFYPDYLQKLPPDVPLSTYQTPTTNTWGIDSSGLVTDTESASSY